MGWIGCPVEGSRDDPARSWPRVREVRALCAPGTFRGFLALRLRRTFRLRRAFRGFPALRLRRAFRLRRSVRVPRDLQVPAGNDQVGVGQTPAVRLAVSSVHPEDLRIPSAVAELLLGNPPQRVAPLDHVPVGVPSDVCIGRQSQRPSRVETPIGTEGPAVGLHDPLIQCRDLGEPLPGAQVALRETPERVVSPRRDVRPIVGRGRCGGGITRCDAEPLGSCTPDLHLIGGRRDQHGQRLLTGACRARRLARRGGGRSGNEPDHDQRDSAGHEALWRRQAGQPRAGHLAHRGPDLDGHSDHHDRPRHPGDREQHQQDQAAVVRASQPRRRECREVDRQGRTQHHQDCRHHQRDCQQGHQGRAGADDRRCRRLRASTRRSGPRAVWPGSGDRHG